MRVNKKVSVRVRRECVCALYVPVLTTFHCDELMTHSAASRKRMVMRAQLQRCLQLNQWQPLIIGTAADEFLKSR